jgi:hypothetical protein
MQLRGFELKAKAQKIVTCLMTLVVFSLLLAAQPGPAGASSQSGYDYHRHLRRDR